MKICRITFLIVDRDFAFILYALFAGVVLGFTFDSALAKDELCYFDKKTLFRRLILFKYRSVIGIRYRKTRETY